jgi:hypothetical protein
LPAGAEGARMHRADGDRFRRDSPAWCLPGTTGSTHHASWRPSNGCLGAVGDAVSAGMMLLSRGLRAGFRPAGPAGRTAQ